MSAEEVEDSLVLTTGSEEQLFKKRDIFDIVVYYDQQTQANNFLHSAPINDQEKCLRNLHYALWEYAYRKKLKKPPRMLAGGLDAWVDFIGPQSLKTTQVSSSQINQTSTRTNLTGEVAGRVLPSQHLNSNSSGANGVAQSHWRPILQNKVAPPSIDFEEEQRWLDQLQRESDPLTMTVPLSPNATTDDKTKRRGTSLVSTTSSVPYPRTVEEFVCTLLVF